jgi:hypothetical protein
MGAKLLLLSVVISMIAIPMVTARVIGGRRGLQWAIILIVLFNLFYMFAIRYIYPHLL